MGAASHAGRCSYCDAPAVAIDSATRQPACRQHFSALSEASAEAEWADVFADAWALEVETDTARPETVVNPEWTVPPPDEPFIRAGRRPVWWLKMTGRFDPRDGQQLWAEEESLIDELPASEPLFEDGPSIHQIRQWREIYAGVFVTSFHEDFHVVWRIITRAEWKTIEARVERIEDISYFDRDNRFVEELAASCCLYPRFRTSDFDRGLAGIPELLSRQIIAASGFACSDVREL